MADNPSPYISVGGEDEEKKNGSTSTTPESAAAALGSQFLLTQREGQTEMCCHWPGRRWSLLKWDLHSKPEVRRELKDGKRRKSCTPLERKWSNTFWHCADVARRWCCSWYIELQCDYMETAVPGKNEMSIQGWWPHCSSVDRSISVIVARTFSPVGLMPLASLESPSVGGRRREAHWYFVKSKAAKMTSLTCLYIFYPLSLWTGEQETRMKGPEVDRVRRNIKNQLSNKERQI